jgi:hypothetical protein
MARRCARRHFSLCAKMASEETQVRRVPAFIGDPGDEPPNIKVAGIDNRQRGAWII